MLIEKSKQEIGGSGFTCNELPGIANVDQDEKLTSTW